MLGLDFSGAFIPVAIGIVAIAAQVGWAICARAAAIGLALLRCLLLRRRLDRWLIIGFLAQSGKLHPGAVRALVLRGVFLLLVVSSRLHGFLIFGLRFGVLRDLCSCYFRGRFWGCFLGAGFCRARLGGRLCNGFFHCGNGGGGVIAAAASGAKRARAKKGIRNDFFMPRTVDKQGRRCRSLCRA